MMVGITRVMTAFETGIFSNRAVLSVFISDFLSNVAFLVTKLYTLPFIIKQSASFVKEEDEKAPFM